MESECMYVVRACGCALCVLAGDLRFFFFFCTPVCAFVRAYTLRVNMNMQSHLVFHAAPLLSVKYEQGGIAVAKIKSLRS